MFPRPTNFRSVFGIIMFVLALVLYCVLRFCFVSIRFGFCLCFGVEYLTEVVEATGCPSVVRRTTLQEEEYILYYYLLLLTFLLLIEIV